MQSALRAQRKGGTKHGLSKRSQVTKPEEFFLSRCGYQFLELFYCHTANFPHCYGHIRPK